MSLKGKTVFITGGTGGIGKPLVHYLSQAGAIITCHNRERDGDLIDNNEAIINNLKTDTPDILVNMAGCSEFGYAETQNYKKLIDLNLLVPMTLAQAVLPEMKKRKSGQIINIGSMMGLIPLPHFSGYSAAKAGLKAFSQSLHRELQPYKIHVSYIAPRAVQTNMNTGNISLLNEQTKTNTDHPDDVAKEIFQTILKKTVEKKFGKPEQFFAFLNAICPRLVDHGLKRNTQLGEKILNN